MIGTIPMIRAYAVIFVISAVVGILSGYIISTMLRDSVQMELQLLAQQLPSAHTNTEQKLASTTSQLYNREDRDKFLSEVAEVVQRAVVLSLQQHREVQANNMPRQQRQSETSDFKAMPVRYDNHEVIRSSIISANEVLDSAIARGQWDETDAQAYRDALQKVPAEEQGKAYQNARSIIPQKSRHR